MNKYIVGGLAGFILSNSTMLRAELTDIEEIKAALAEQTRMLQEQQRTIEIIKKQNKQFREIIEAQQVVPAAIATESESLDTNDDLLAHEQVSSVIDYDAEGSWRFSITPRTGLRVLPIESFNNSNLIQGTIEQPQVWINGGTLSMTTPWLPNTSFYLPVYTVKSAVGVGLLPRSPKKTYCKPYLSEPIIKEITLTLNG